VPSHPAKITHFNVRDKWSSLGKKTGIIFQIGTTQKSILKRNVFLQTIMNSPHDSESWATNLIKGFPTCYHFPKDNTPAEDITFFTVIAT
jgi:hypothetical protein